MELEVKRKPLEMGETPALAFVFDRCLAYWAKQLGIRGGSAHP